MRMVPPPAPRLAAGSFEVVLDGGKDTAQQFDPQRRYVFGFVHHGLYPLGEAGRQKPGWVAGWRRLERLRCLPPALRRSLHAAPCSLPTPGAGAGYIPLMPSFRRLVPVRPVTLTASVCVAVPLLRDIVLWLGARIVSRRTFEHTLRERRAVLICPGGQAEMCLTNRLHRHKEYTVYTGHKGVGGHVCEFGFGCLPCAGCLAGAKTSVSVFGAGAGLCFCIQRSSPTQPRLLPPLRCCAGFVRIALQQGAALVPMLVLGEADSLHNLIEWPSLQRWCTRKLG